MFLLLTRKHTPRDYTVKILYLSAFSLIAAGGFLRFGFGSLFRITKKKIKKNYVNKKRFDK